VQRSQPKSPEITIAHLRIGEDDWLHPDVDPGNGIERIVVRRTFIAVARVRKDAHVEEMVERSIGRDAPRRLGRCDSQPSYRGQIDPRKAEVVGLDAETVGIVLALGSFFCCVSRRRGACLGCRSACMSDKAKRGWSERPQLDAGGNFRLETLTQCLACLPAACARYLHRGAALHLRPFTRAVD
jgi:hypothetical protein